MKPEVVRCVVLADRDQTEGIRGLVETAFDAVVMVADEPFLFERARRLQPLLAVVDLSLVPSEGLGWLKRLRSLCPQLKLILISVHNEPSVCRAAIEAGTDAFVLKRAIATQLLPAVAAVLAGNRYTSPDASIHPSSDERRENF